MSRDSLTREKVENEVVGTDTIFFINNFHIFILSEKVKGLFLFIYFNRSKIGMRLL